MQSSECRVRSHPVMWSYSLPVPFQGNPDGVTPGNYWRWYVGNAPPLHHQRFIVPLTFAYRYSTSIVEEGGSSYVNRSQLFETVVGSKEGHSYLRDEFISMSVVVEEQGTVLLAAFQEHHTGQDKNTLRVSSCRPK